MSAMYVQGQLTAVDMRMPGYPAFLALIYAITGRVGEAARRWVMLGQVGVDLLTCSLIAGVAALLALIANGRARPQRAFITALWLAVLCPFTANYVAVPLTEVFAMLFTTAALLPLCLLVTRAENRGWRLVEKHWIFGHDYLHLAAYASLLIGLCSLFRPVAPLLRPAAKLLEQYNGALAHTTDDDAAYAPLAREGTAPQPVHTYLKQLAARALTLWLTPPIELLRFAGAVFPLGQS